MRKDDDDDDDDILKNSAPWRHAITGGNCLKVLTPGFYRAA